jgi:hypothetical protein
MSSDVGAESVSTMGPDEESVDSQTRTSKQARIRDNQRRSRARRQEHLQDLEKRLSECHLICREADLRLQALKDLQVENARLRQLLEVLGINENLVNTFVHQEAVAAEGSSSTPTLRQLKPKIPLAPNLAKPRLALNDSVAGSRPPSSLAALSPATTAVPSPPAAFFSTWSTSLDASGIPSRDTHGTTSLSNFTFQDPFTTQSFLPQSQEGTTCGDEAVANGSFCCMVFGNKATAPLQASLENTVLCSLAKELIDQYNINREDLEQVKSRLAAGFAPPARPGESCRVNNQVLFDVLNDISGRIS